MATYRIELNNRSINGSKEHILMLRITVDKIHSRMKLIHSVTPGQFNSKTKNDLYIRNSHPNHVKINRYLHQAGSYAPTQELRDLVQLRLNGMNFLVLMHKTDVAFTKGTLPDLQAAKAYLEEADSYASIA